MGRIMGRDVVIGHLRRQVTLGGGLEVHILGVVARRRGEVVFTRRGVARLVGAGREVLRGGRMVGRGELAVHIVRQCWWQVVLGGRLVGGCRARQLLGREVFRVGRLVVLQGV